MAAQFFAWIRGPILLKKVVHGVGPIFIALEVFSGRIENDQSKVLLLHLDYLVEIAPRGNDVQAVRRFSASHASHPVNHLSLRILHGQIASPRRSWLSGNLIHWGLLHA
jgi:hypothetical protein